MIDCAESVTYLDTHAFCRSRDSRHDILKLLACFHFLRRKKFVHIDWAFPDRWF